MSITSIDRGRYTPYVINRFLNRTSGRNLRIQDWIRQGFARGLGPIFRNINTYVNTETPDVKFDIDPNKKDWYVRLRKQIADVLGVPDVDLLYKGRILNEWSLGELSKIPRFAVTMRVREDRGEIPDLDEDLEKSVSEKQKEDLDRTEGLFVEKFAKLLSETTRDLKSEDTVRCVTSQSRLLPLVACALKDPTVYDSCDTNAYKGFMKKFGVDMPQMAMDLSHEVANGLCKSDFGKRGYRRRKGPAFKRKTAKIGEEIKDMSYDDYHQSLIGLNLFSDLKCYWEKLWNCKKKCTRPSQKCCDYRSASSSSSCSSWCSSSSDGCSSASDGYSSDELPNKYTRNGDHCVTDPWKKFWYGGRAKYGGHSTPSSSDHSSECPSSSDDEYEVMPNVVHHKHRHDHYYCGDEMQEDPMPYEDDEEEEQFIAARGFSADPEPRVVQSSTYEKVDADINVPVAEPIGDELDDDDVPDAIPISEVMSGLYERRIVGESDDDEPPEAIPISEAMGVPPAIPLSSLYEEEECDAPPAAIPIEDIYDESKSNGKAEVEEDEFRQKRPPRAIPIGEQCDDDKEGNLNTLSMQLNEDRTGDLNDVLSRPPRVVMIEECQGGEPFDESEDEVESYVQQDIGQEQFSKIQSDASNFLSVYNSVKGYNYDPKKSYTVFAPHDKVLTRKATNTLMNGSEERRRKFVQSYIAPGNGEREGARGPVQLKTIGSRIFEYDAGKACVKGRSDNFKVHGAANHPKQRNVTFVLQDGLHNRMTSAV